MSNPVTETPFSAPLDIRLIGAVEGRYTFAKRPGEDAAVVAYACRTQSLSPTSVTLSAPVSGAVGQGINLLLEHIGLLKGSIARRVPGGFQLDLAGGPAAQAKLAAKINWLKKRNIRQAVDKRDAPRYRPRNPSAHLYVDAAEHDCFIIDVSISGVGISAAVRPPVGTAIAVGLIAGRVVRHMDVGFGVQFEAIQDAELLAEGLNARRPEAPAKAVSA